ncbi:MAG: tetratricopeptide repeat protein [Deltaproteobacteria bacterium]|jgi:tetratricopeptide (TPR) repeat protein|nr:tetratricopeptide repeat protein [Deltaproteobacteria bacterium]
MAYRFLNRLFKIWPGTIAVVTMVFFFLSGCASPPKRLLPKEITIGSLTGPAGSLLAQDLNASSATSYREKSPLVFEAETTFTYDLEPGTEEVLDNYDLSQKPNLEYLPNGLAYPSGSQSFKASDLDQYKLTRVTATLTAIWTLKDPTQGLVVKSGSTSDTFKTSVGGYLAYVGAASRNAPSEREVLRTMSSALADQLIGELGPALSVNNISRASDERSKMAFDLASKGQWEEAAVLWRELIALNPNYAPAHYNLGIYHERLGQLHEAWESYRQAFLSNSSPVNRQALTRMTDSLERLGRPPKPGGEGFDPTK